jgi:hypothetical protein
VYLVDLNPRVGRPSCSFQVLLKLRVVRHLLKVFSGVPHVDYHHAIVGSRTGVRYALRLLAGNEILELSIVGAKVLVGVSFPPEQNEYGHYRTLLPRLLGYVYATYPLTTTGMMPSKKG